MNILIIEDELPTARHIERLIASIRPEASVMGPLSSVKDAVKWFSANPEPDLILCDIQLSDGMSFEIFEQLKLTSPVIFITAYDQFAIRAFKLNSIDYLLKPVDPEELKQAIEKLENRQYEVLSPQLIKKLLQNSIQEYKTRFMIKLGDKIKSITTEDILYFFSEDKYTYLHHNDGRNYITDFSLNELESILDPKQFFRLNRQYIASIESITEVLIYSGSRLKISLENCTDNSILVSRSKTDDFKLWMDGNPPS